jgi:ATP-dependent Lhr-like helicase
MMLAPARTVIVDEIHAVAGSKRGSHLALSLERLQALAGPRLQRIGLSATQKPIEEIARFLVGGGTVSPSPHPCPALTLTPSPAGRGRRADARSGAHPFTLGAGESVNCHIIDSGHIRDRDLALELPPAPLEAVMSGEVWETIYDRLAALAHEHRTTLIFANTRRMVERVTHHLGERLGRDNVAAHHGSLSKETRLDAEQRLKSGKLRALVATASLELGIDIGDVDLVCQLGTPRSIATFLQRVGRSGHGPDALPKGRLFPLSRDELVECAALLDGVRRGELDRLIIPAKPLDVLAQQIVAEVAAREWGEDELFESFHRAYPYRELTHTEFDTVVRMLSDGFATRRGRRSAHLHRDAVNHRLRARKGARLTALTSGGAIPDNADYSVILEPTGTFIGTVNEDFAVESLTGDVFQLGNHSYRILKIETGKMRVEDAKGAPPNIPFWLGEAPSRTAELSAAVARLRSEVDRRLEHVNAESMELVKGYLARELGLGTLAAEQLTEYLASAKGVLGVLPTQDTLVFERFFDETGGQQLVIHAPFGSRVNRAWGLALRKRFCRKFNFELQAAATEDAIILSLGETHSFELAEVARYLASATVRPILVQALLAAPMFGARWRWVANIALAVKRFRGGKKNPPPLQRIEAEDLMAVVFPDGLACFENIQGDRELPDHPLVNQAVHDCLTEAMDIEGLEKLLAALERGEKSVIARDLPHPSPLAQEILNARPYAFLDDAPLEERRTQAVMGRRWLDPTEARDFGQLDAEAIERVRAEAWPQVESADELHDALMTLGVVTEEESNNSGWSSYFEGLIADRRATRLLIRVPSPLMGEGQDGGERPGAAAASHPHPNPPPSRGRELRHGFAFWVAVEQLPMARAIWPHVEAQPALEPPAEYAARQWTPEEARIELLRGRLQGSGPLTVAQLAVSLGLNTTDIETSLAVLETEGFAMRGEFTPPSPSFDRNGDLDQLPLSLRERAKGEGDHPSSPSLLPEGEGGEPRLAARAPRSIGEGGEPSRAARAQLPSPSFPLPEGEGGEPMRAARAPHNLEWCERRLLARIHRYTIERLRAEIEPVNAADYLRFLFEWQGLTAEPKPEGPQALATVVESLEGFEAPAAAWEADILPTRLHDYDPEWLDSLCRAGRATWMRLTVPRPAASKDRGPSPVRTTPIAVLTRRNLAAWRTASSPHEAEALRLSPRAQSVADFLAGHGASFFDEITTGTGLLKTQAEEALGELVALGLAAADSFAGLRALLVPADKRGGYRGRRRHLAEFGIEEAGRWALVRRTGVRDEETIAATSGAANPPRANSHQTRAKRVRLASLSRDSGRGNEGEGLRAAPFAKGGPANTPFGRSRASMRSAALGLLSVDKGGRPKAGGISASPEQIELIARTLLKRYGVVFKRVLEHEASFLPSWFELLRVFRRLEARGELRGGRFVAGMAGEQYALPEVVSALRAVRKKPRNAKLVSVSAADPLNLVGSVLPGTRVPALAGNRILFRDGVPIAVQVGGEAHFLEKLEPAQEWEARTALLRQPMPPAVRAYLH